MFNLENLQVGSYEGVGILSPFDTQEMTKPLPMPMSPIQEPTGIIQEPTGIIKVPIVDHLKVRFQFNQKDSITVMDGGKIHLAQLHDGSQLFMISALGLIAGGTGRYDGATGIQSATGSALLPPGKLTLSPGAVFSFKTFYSLHVVRRAAV